MATVVDLIRTRAAQAEDCLLFFPLNGPVQRWSYKEMWVQVSELAAALQQVADVGSRVAVLVEEGPSLPLLELAVLVASMIIVPIDPSQPKERLKLMIADIEPAMLVTLSVNLPAVKECVEMLQSEGMCKTSKIVSVEHLMQQHKSSSSSSPSSSRLPTPSPSDVSHIFFTSGSTGRPKGCICTHAALLAYCHAKNQAHRVDSASVVFVASTLSFDPSLGDFTATWTAGARLAIAPKAAVFTSLGQCLSLSNATHILTTPSMFSTVNHSPSDLSSLRVVALGGEVMPKKIVEQWAEKVTLMNTYGVTECCVYQACAVVTSEGDVRKLGDPLPGNEYFVVAGEGDDPSQLVAAGSGDEGELWLAGVQVGLGYWKRPQLSRKKFVNHSRDGPCFRTGDIVRASRNGYFEMVGRRDAQVKIRGQRVELGEIEQVLRSVTDILADVAVILHGQLLVAYVILATAVDVMLLADVLRQLCSTKLPLHMIPSRYISVSVFPRTGTGKLNRLELSQTPLPVVEQGESNGASIDGGEEDEKCEYGGWDVCIRQVWSEELGVACTLDTHFFEMGGESLGALRVCRRLQLLRKNEEKAGEFGELLGALAPAELLKRPRLRDFVIHVFRTFGNFSTAAPNVVDQKSNNSKNSSSSSSGASSVSSQEGELSGLLMRAVGAGSLPLVTLLLKNNAQAWARAKDVSSPLHLACANGQLEVATALLSAKAPAGARDRNGVTPLHLACHKGPEALVQLLLQAKATLTALDDSQQTVLHHAARACPPSKVFTNLLDRWEADAGVVKARGNVDSMRDVWGRTPLHWAVVNGHRTMVAPLIERGANPKLKDGAGETSLEIAERRAQCGNAERPDAARASVWGDIAKLLGGSGKTKKT